VRNSDANREVTATSLSSEMEGLFTKHLEQETQELLPMAGLVTVLVGSPTLLLGQHFGLTWSPLLELTVLRRQDGDIPHCPVLISVTECRLLSSN